MILLMKESFSTTESTSVSRGNRTELCNYTLSIRLLCHRIEKNTTPAEGTQPMASEEVTDAIVRKETDRYLHGAGSSVLSSGQIIRHPEQETGIRIF